MFKYKNPVSPYSVVCNLPRGIPERSLLCLKRCQPQLLTKSLEPENQTMTIQPKSLSLLHLSVLNFFNFQRIKSAVFYFSGNVSTQSTQSEADNQYYIENNVLACMLYCLKESDWMAVRTPGYKVRECEFQFCLNHKTSWVTGSAIFYQSQKEDKWKTLLKILPRKLQRLIQTVARSQDLKAQKYSI